ncbi:MAG: UvrD-helicase domain-containing protein, partial [Anaerolineales bacterium]|nr:UvrD-helicase domain-containing protein [Anaerolineales bacterium]
MDILKNLNPAQREAVQAIEGPVLVLAGPGSGKTRVLTHRVAYLVSECGVDPYNIMTVTFTNKAAQEMKGRLHHLLGQRLRRLTIGTFHSICSRILRREAERLDVSSDFVIYDQSDQLGLVRQALKDLNLDDKMYRPQAMLGTISRAKNELIGPEAFAPQTYWQEVAGRVYTRYQELLLANNAQDFDDLLMNAVHLFTRHPDVLTKYQRRYLHILVDEFQDTNTAQYALVKRLAEKNGNLFAVGDEDQSIYAFRGADFRNVHRFRRDYPDARIVLLEQNYRSTQTVLDVAEAVISHNTHRTPKDLRTEKGRGLPIVVHEAYNEQEEAQYVVDQIALLTAEGTCRPGDCAIMYRTNAQSRVLEDAFVRAGLPYKLVGATRFYARREIKDVVAYLRLVYNPRDSISLDRIINVPARGIGAKTRGDLEEWAGDLKVPIHTALQMLREEPEGATVPFSTYACNVLVSFSELLDGLMAAREKLNVLELLDLILEKSGYSAYIRDGTEEGEDRWNNIRELRTVAQEYLELSPGESLSTFLEEVALVSDIDNLDEAANAPTLLTLHMAKGLEFPVVFIVGLEDGLFPHSRSFDDPEAMEEERRLCYVGITRAKERVYLVHAFRRTMYGESQVGEPSRFIADIPDQLIAGRGEAQAEFG